MLAAAKYIGAGLAAIGLTGAGIGIGQIFFNSPKPRTTRTIILIRYSWIRPSRSNWAIRAND
jgi:hypothetical protein